MYELPELTELQNRIAELERENKYLKSLLDHAGISYTQNLSVEVTTPQKTLETNQGDRIIPVQITPDHIRMFYSYFWGRMDVFSKRYLNKTTGRAGYFPQCDNF